MAQNIRVDAPIHWYFSADAFHMWATQYYKCKQGFEYSGRISPVPYFLLCRSIELELKSRHLKHKTQKQVKDEFRHDLIKSYEALEPADQLLNVNEIDVLKRANIVYAGKGFEYCAPMDVLKGYPLYPELEELDSITKILLGIT